MDALAAGGELGTNEIARRTGVNASTVSRLLATLASAGYVDQAANGRYRLGIRLVQLGNAVVDRLDLRELARPELERLVERVGETATLSVAGGYEAVTVDFVQSPSSVQGVAQLGRPSVAHATATGKVLLAFGGIGLPPGPLRRYTARTIADPRALAREIERARARGWSDAVGEREEDLAGVAAPVRGSRGELAAIIGVQGPTARLDAKARAAALEPLLACSLGPVAAPRLGRELAQPVGRGPDETAGIALDPPRRLAEPARADPRRIRSEDEQAGLALGDELEERVDRPRRSQPQPLDLDTERVGEVRGRPKRLLDVRRHDRVVAEHERARLQARLDGVDDEERLTGLDRRVDGDRRRLRGQRRLERREDDRPPRRARRRARDDAGGAVSHPERHSGWSSHFGASPAARRTRRRQNGM